MYPPHTHLIADSLTRTRVRLFPPLDTVYKSISRVKQREGLSHRGFNVLTTYGCGDYSGGGFGERDDAGCIDRYSTAGPAEQMN